MSYSNNDGYLSVFGKKLIENGYNIIPIPTGSKSPGFSGWEKTKSTPNLLKEWLLNGHDNSGVGILTKFTPAIDLDILDKEVAELMEQWCFENIGVTPVRIGRAPKRVLVYRTNEPFRKMKTGKFVDEWEQEQEVEILGDGQQFIAYGIHKDTGQPYNWINDGSNPENIHSEELPIVTPEQCKELMAYFVEIAKGRGWERKSKGLSGEVRAIDSEDDPFADVESVVDIPTDELRNRLMMVPAADDYDRWVQIGMALYHQFGGEDTGLELWHEWSETADNYDAEGLDKHWKSFAIEGKRRSPVTARTILKLAKEAVTTQTIVKINELKDSFLKAKDEFEWREVCAQVRKSEIDALARSQIVEIARKRYQDLTGYKLPIVEARRTLAYEMPNSTKTPKWCHDWVFDASCDKFFHIKTKITMTMQGFNAVYSRHALTKKDLLEGKTSPSSSPCDLALNVYKVQEVYGYIYAPGKDEIFSRDGLRVANTYREYQVPELPDRLTPADKKAITTVKNHISHILDDESERELFTDWLAWVVQNPGKLVNWAMVLQGVEGDGKSFFGLLLRAVMGHANVRMMNAAILEGNFTGWAVGQCVAVVEEPRLQGQNRYDVINKIKPFITNPVIEIHAKGRDPFDAENTTNYYMPTNFKDALPLTDNNRRFCVLMSQWQQLSDIREFNIKNPKYYVNLYETIRDHVPALRKWLVEHEVTETFPAGGNAPQTKGLKYMVEATTPDLINTIGEIIREAKFADISNDLLNASRLPDVLLSYGEEVPPYAVIRKMLEHNGFTYLGRFNIDYEGSRGQLWSKHPAKFRNDLEGGLEYSPAEIRRFVDVRKMEIDEDEL